MAVGRFKKRATLGLPVPSISITASLLARGSRITFWTRTPAVSTAWTDLAGPADFHALATGNGRDGQGRPRPEVLAAGDVASVTLTDQANGYVIADAVMLTSPDPLPNTATWTPNIANAGQYEVYARWTQHANRATNADGANISRAMIAAGRRQELNRYAALRYKARPRHRTRTVFY